MVTWQARTINIYMKKAMSKTTASIILSSILLAGVLSIVVPVAKVRALNGNFVDRMANRASAAAVRQDDALSRIIARGDTMIQARLTTLSNLLTRIQNDTRLSTDEKSSFTADVNTTTTNLQALKTKLDADTDATTALADAKSIVTSYRIYLIFEPKERLLIIDDNLSTASTTLSGLITQIQNLLNTLKSEGKDTTVAQNALNDASTQVSNINTILTTDKTLLTNVTIGTSNPQSIFVQVRQDFATVRADVARIRS